MERARAALGARGPLRGPRRGGRRRGRRALARAGSGRCVRLLGHRLEGGASLKKDGRGGRTAAACALPPADAQTAAAGARAPPRRCMPCARRRRRGSLGPRRGRRPRPGRRGNCNRRLAGRRGARGALRRSRSMAPRSSASLLCGSAGAATPGAARRGSRTGDGRAVAAVPARAGTMPGSALARGVAAALATSPSSRRTWVLMWSWARGARRARVARSAAGRRARRRERRDGRPRAREITTRPPSPAITVKALRSSVAPA